MGPAEFSIGKFLTNSELSGLVKSIMSKESEVASLVISSLHARTPACLQKERVTRKVRNSVIARHTFRLEGNASHVKLCIPRLNRNYSR